MTFQACLHSGCLHATFCAPQHPLPPSGSTGPPEPAVATDASVQPLPAGGPWRPPAAALGQPHRGQRSAQPAPALAEESGCGRMRRTGSCLGGCSSQQARVFALLHFRTGLNEPTVLALPATAPPRPVSGRFVAGFSKHSSAAHRPWSGIKLFAPSPLCSRPGFPPFSSPAHPTFPGERRRADCPQCPWPQWS